MTLITSSLALFCKGFVDISYENASCHILEDSIWLQLIYFLTTIAVLKYLFPTDGDINYLRLLAKDFTLRSTFCSNQPLWKIHGIAYMNFDFFTTDESNQVKIALGRSCIIFISPFPNSSYYKEFV